MTVSEPVSKSYIAAARYDIGTNRACYLFIFIFYLRTKSAFICVLSVSAPAWKQIQKNFPLA